MVARRSRDRGVPHGDAEGTITVAGRPIHYQQYGAGEPVVLVHGLAGSGRWWRHNILDLADHFRVIALNLSRRERWLDRAGQFTIDEVADVLAEWLIRMGLDSAHVVGHSLGGNMAIRLAAAHPARVKRLVLVDSAGLPLGTGLIRFSCRALRPTPEYTRAFQHLVLTDAIRANPLVLLRTARELLRDDVTPLLDRIAASTLIIWGERDHMVPVAHAHRLHAGIKNSRLLIVPHAGHNPMYHHPGTFNRVVLEFLRGEQASSERQGGQADDSSGAASTGSG